MGQGIAGNVNGIPVRIGSAAFCGGKELPRGNGDAHVHITLGGVHRGYYVIRKRARSGIVNAVHELRKTMRVALLTGDASVDAELTHAFANATVVTSCTPVDKGAIIAEQQNGHRVVMVGDGLNDAGALAQSDVGITVTETTAALTPASDAIMDANALEQLPHFLLMARRARRIVIASLIISLCYNITGVAFAISGQLTPLFAAILMPLSSVTVVAFVSVAVWLGARR
ncbi:MAG: HAD-IC family P-type ATPase [Flavobacteriales bacterium]|nr:HAD-IC family P-type ATPase [Flavobacteriales bacterium]